MRFFKETTKAKVVTGFCLSITVVAVAIYLFYASFTKLLSSVELLSQPNVKLAKLHHTLADIATAESAIRAYTLTTDDQYFKAYLAHLEDIDRQVDTLRTLMNGSTHELTQLDSVSVLLQAKQQSMARYVELKKQRRELNFSDKALRQITLSASRQPATTIIKEQTTTTIAPRTNPPTEAAAQPADDRRGFLGRLFSKRQSREQAEQVASAPAAPRVLLEQEICVDTTTTPLPQPVAQVSAVKHILQDIKTEVSRHDKKVAAKELALLQQDKQIMDQIRAMIYSLERSEAQQAAQNSASARAIVNKTSVVLLCIGAFGLISCILFIWIILRDLTRSNAYKAQLIRARKEALQLARAKEAFVANMSHEIRTPLNVVLGFAEQLGQTPLQAAQQEHLQAISSAGEHLLHIVNDVLDLSRLEAGKLVLEATPFNIQQLLAELEQVFRLKAETKGIAFSCEADKELPAYLLGDPLRLKQVLFNLADNALKFTHQGQVRVVCSLQSQRRGRVVVCITVADTGIGIPLEQAEHVFGEFNQADDSIIRKYGGTGLGLSISKQLVEMQRGNLTLQSVPGQGTTFTIRLPFKKATVPAAQPEPQTQGQPQAQAFKGSKVLVIDDDAYSRTLCEMMLKRWGVTVQLANDGQEALQRIGQEKFDAVLTDIQLPGMSGKAVARAIRKQDATIPIIALTANIMSRHQQFFANTGITDYLLKPFSEQELYRKLAKVLKSAPGISLLQPPQPLLLQTESKGPAYDLSEIKAFAGDDDEALAAILEALLNDHRQNFQLLLAAAAANDWQQAGALAHKMQTAFKHLRAQSVVKLLDELEQVLHQEQQEAVRLQWVVEQLQVGVPVVLEAIAAEVKSLREAEQRLVL
ncbi:hybrid sensor histidine kinase/response regulator [Botryobacter ruber]|uniref:hybrid sensor histidine kinase/response regulator n=1 Tax=Botryobacter ruber TaxID=2171629 RepID=UPI000E0B4453|nr:ATP-binding protein [Botryobacter ruber]